jgi:hypothetical protein
MLVTAQFPRWVAAVSTLRVAPAVSCRCASSAPRAKPMPPASGGRKDRMRPRTGDPFFRDVWRRFQLKVHPDLFAQFPELQSVNSDSLQRLQGLLNEVKSLERPDEDRVRARSEKLQFFVRANPGAGPGEKPHFHKIPVTVSLAGGFAHNSLALSLSRLFGAIDLPVRWQWGPDYFSSTFVPSKEPPPEQPGPQ